MPYGSLAKEMWSIWMYGFFSYLFMYVFMLASPLDVVSLVFGLFVDYQQNMSLDYFILNWSRYNCIKDDMVCYFDIMSSWILNLLNLVCYSIPRIFPIWLVLFHIFGLVCDPRLQSQLMILLLMAVYASFWPKSTASLREWCGDPCTSKSALSK